MKRFVERHEGTVEVKSGGIEKCSEFIITFPDTSGVNAMTFPRIDSSTGSGVTSSIRILVIDDNRDSADCLAMLLGAPGHETATVYDGEEALASVDSFSPDVMLLDIGLPGMSGYEICRRLRDRPGGNDLVIFAQTGWGRDEDRPRTQESGFDCHFVKPVDPAGLLAKLNDVEKRKENM